MPANKLRPSIIVGNGREEVGNARGENSSQATNKRPDESKM